MRKKDISTAADALGHMIECTLATVERMSMLKCKSKSEYRRQISIAQTGCDWAQKFGVDIAGTRAEEIVGIQTVEEWARKLEDSVLNQTPWYR